MVGHLEDISSERGPDFTASGIRELSENPFSAAMQGTHRRTAVKGPYLTTGPCFVGTAMETELKDGDRPEAVPHA